MTATPALGSLLIEGAFTGSALMMTLVSALVATPPLRGSCLTMGSDLMTRSFTASRLMTGSLTGSCLTRSSSGDSRLMRDPLFPLSTLELVSLWKKLRMSYSSVESSSNSRPGAYGPESAPSSPWGGLGGGDKIMLVVLGMTSSSRPWTR